MAFDHSACEHPRTPAGRAACRKQRAGGSQPAAKTRKTTRGCATPGCHREAAHIGFCTPDNPDAKLTAPKPSTKSLKRPGTQIKGVADMADVPRVFTPAIEAARSLGCIVRAGEPYNDRERRVELFGPAGVITLIWLAANPHGVNDVQFRPAKSSVASRQPSVNEALRVAGIAA